MIQEVLKRSRFTNLKINPTKCDFSQNRVPFRSAIPTGPTEKNPNFRFVHLTIHTLKTLLKQPHFSNAIENFAHLDWTLEAQDVSETLKFCLTPMNIMVFPMMNESSYLCTDVYITPLGTVLSYMQDGQQRAICYASKCFPKP